MAVWREGWRAIRPEVGARGGRGPRRRSGGSFLAELCKRTSEAEGPRQDKARRRTGFALDSQVKDIEMSVCVRYAETCFVLALVTRTRASRVTSGSTLVPYDRRSTAPRPRARPPRAEHGGLRGRVRSLRSPRRARSADRDGRGVVGAIRGVSHKPSRFTGLPTMRARLAGTRQSTSLAAQGHKHPT